MAWSTNDTTTTKTGGDSAFNLVTITTPTAPAANPWAQKSTIDWGGSSIAAAAPIPTQKTNGAPPAPAAVVVENGAAPVTQQPEMKDQTTVSYPM